MKPRAVSFAPSTLLLLVLGGCPTVIEDLDGGGGAGAGSAEGAGAPSGPGSGAADVGGGGTTAATVCDDLCSVQPFCVGVQETSFCLDICGSVDDACLGALVAFYECAAPFTGLNCDYPTSCTSEIHAFRECTGVDSCEDESCPTGSGPGGCSCDADCLGVEVFKNCDATSSVCSCKVDGEMVGSCEDELGCGGIGCCAAFLP